MINKISYSFNLWYMYSDGDQEYYKGRGNKKAIDII